VTGRRVPGTAAKATRAAAIGPPLGPPPPPGPLVLSPPAPPSRGRSCRALPRRHTGRQRWPWPCHIRRHCPPGHPRCGRVRPRRLLHRVRSARKMLPPLFRSSPPPMLQVLARLPPLRIVRSCQGSCCRSRLGRHPCPASDMFLLSSVVCFLCCSIATAAERSPGRLLHQRPGARDGCGGAAVLDDLVAPVSPISVGPSPQGTAARRPARARPRWLRRYHDPRRYPLLRCG
jgi:hypothetical protein